MQSDDINYSLYLHLTKIAFQSTVFLQVYSTISKTSFLLIYNAGILNPHVILWRQKK